MLEQLEASRAQYAEEVAAADKAIKPAEQALAQPVANFITELRSWLDRSRLDGDFDGWPELLKSWRSALGMTTREAAAALDVSPSAVVRYEGATRSPSAPYVAAMVDRIEQWNPTSEDTKLRSAARIMARIFGGDAETATEILEKQAMQTDALAAAVEDALAGLSPVQLRVVASLVATPSALDELAALVRHNPLGAVMETLAHVDDEAISELGR